MKYVIVILFAIFLLSKAFSPLPICNSMTAKQALPPRIFAETTIDGRDQSIIITRFLHNKVGILLSEFGRCYLNVFDPNFIVSTVGFVGLLMWLYFVFKILEEKRLWVIVLVLIVPIIPFISLPTQIAAYFYKIFAMIGLLFFLKNKNLL